MNTYRITTRAVTYDAYDIAAVDSAHAERILNASGPAEITPVDSVTTAVTTVSVMRVDTAGYHPESLTDSPLKNGHDCPDCLDRESWQTLAQELRAEVSSLSHLLDAYARELVNVRRELENLKCDIGATFEN